MISLTNYKDEDTDFDTTFELSATMVNGSDIPSWSIFSKKTRTFYGTCPLEEFLSCSKSNGIITLPSSSISYTSSESKVKNKEAIDAMASLGVNVRYKECYYPIKITAFEDYANISSSFTLIVYDYSTE